MGQELEQGVWSVCSYPWRSIWRGRVLHSLESLSLTAKINYQSMLGLKEGLILGAVNGRSPSSGQPLGAARCGVSTCSSSASAVATQWLPHTVWKPTWGQSCCYQQTLTQWHCFGDGSVCLHRGTCACRMAGGKGSVRTGASATCPGSLNPPSPP